MTDHINGKGVQYYKDLVNVYDSVSTQKQIPKEFIVPVFDHIYEQIKNDGRMWSEVFEVCMMLIKEHNITSIEELAEWLNKNTIQLV